MKKPIRYEDLKSELDSVSTEYRRQICNFDRTNHSKFDNWLTELEKRLSSISHSLDKDKDDLEKLKVEIGSVKARQTFRKIFKSILVILSLFITMIFVVFSVEVYSYLKLETELPIPNKLVPYALRESFDNYEILIPSDPNARYWVLEKGISDAKHTIVTKREGSEYTSYSKRIYDCDNHTVKYIGDGDTLVAMNESRPDPQMGPIVDGSIAYYVGIEACK